MRESDLYLPVKRFLESQGYEVKGELADATSMDVEAYWIDRIGKFQAQRGVELAFRLASPKFDLPEPDEVIAGLQVTRSHLQLT